MGAGKGSLAAAYNFRIDGNISTKPNAHMTTSAHATSVAAGAPKPSEMAPAAKLPNDIATEQGKDFTVLSIAEKEALWEQAKAVVQPPTTSV